MSVQASAQPLLVKVVGNQTDAPTENKETVKNAHGEIVLSFFRGEGAAVTEEVDEADSDTAVHVEDEIVLLGGGNGLDGDGVIEKFVGAKILHDEFFDQLHT